MSSTAELKNVPLRQDFEFNWIFLAEFILCGVLTVFFLFYFNRVIATILSYGVRSWTWHKYRVYVDVKSFQVSILAGRVFFKNFRYHGNNETIFIQSGYITWRYWLRSVRQLAINRDSVPDLGRFTHDKEKDEIQNEWKADSKGEGQALGKLQKLPCRLIISLKGVEWFIYNRSLAYDTIADSLSHAKSETSDNISIPSDKNKSEPLASDASIKFGHKDAIFQQPSNSHKKRTESPDFGLQNTGDSFTLRFLPIQIECDKAAVVVGNQNTRSVFISKIDKALGEIDATDSPSKLDLYRQLINVHFEHPLIQIKPNDDFKEDQAVTGSRVAKGGCDPLQENKTDFYQSTSFRRLRLKIWQIFKNFMSALQTQDDPLDSGMNKSGLPEAKSRVHNWQGLSRYLEDSQDDNHKWSSIEYAAVLTILESLSADMEFYWDAVGLVREQASHNKEISDENINRDAPPEWGINLSVGAATINYGPWADRQRADIQKVFFPSLCKDVLPAQKLLPGQFRVPTEFKLNIEFDEESVLRIPIKEESKNWKWEKQADIIDQRPKNHLKNGKNGRKLKSDTCKHGSKARPFGWLDLKFGANSVLKHCVDIFPGPEGYSSRLNIDLPTVEITTSVNHGLLWKSVHNRICCDLSNPLNWNGPRVWNFDINSKGLELFILREHIFLITDLVDDWANGPPSDYLTFCPFQYLINLHLEDFRIYFNVNDSNIINNPSDFDDNAFIVLLGTKCDADILLPHNYYRPYHNEISFDVCIEHAGLSLLVPPWNTHATFLSSKNLATLKRLDLNGIFDYCSTISSSNIDTLILDLNFHYLSAQIYGFAIRFLLKIKDNYFGEDIHFKTLEEHQKGLNSHSRDRNTQQSKKKSNDLDIIMGLNVDLCNFYLPSNLYSANNNICIEIANVSLDLRFNNYYMDYALDFNTMTFSQGDDIKRPISPTRTIQVFVDGLSIFESRLFGLPPTEPTYVCNRDFYVGAVTGECATEFLRRLICGAKVFAFSFDDDENVLPYVSEQNLHEIIFFKATFESLDILLHVGDSKFILSTEKISINFNNWAGRRYSKKLKILIPELKLGCVNAESASRHKSKAQNLVETDALFQSTLSFVMIEKNPNFEKDRQLQQEHVHRHDQRTHRCDFLLHSDSRRSMITPVELPTMKTPPMPIPLVNGNLISNKFGESPRQKHCEIMRKSSSLSQDSFSTQSTINHKFSKSFLGKSDGRTLNFFPQDLKSYIKEKRTSFRDLSTSTGRHSSFYSAVDKNLPNPQASIPCSNTHLEPDFPSSDVELDTHKFLGCSVESKEKKSNLENQKDEGNFHNERLEDYVMHTSYLVSFKDSVRGVFNPKAIYAIAELLSTIQATNPIDLLDELQISSITEIKSKNIDELLPRATFDLELQVPSLNFRFLNSKTYQGTKNEEQDQFDLSISRLNIIFRSEITMKTNDTLRNPAKNYKLYVSISSAGFATKEKFSDTEEIQALISCFLGDFHIWATCGDRSNANIKLKIFELVTSSGKVGNLASMLHRINSLVTRFSEIFSTLSEQKHTRIKLFTFLVATTGQRVSEPLFLTRPSYVLRSAADHLRTKDSWTIICRLHHIFNCLEESTQHEISSCIRNSTSLPDDAKQRTLTSLAQCRNWNLNSMDNCIVISKVFGSKQSDSWNPFSSNYLKVSLESEVYRLVIDPGPKQNEISMSQVFSYFERNTDIPNPKTKSQIDNETSKLIVIKISLESFSICLNWELYQMTQDILRLRNQNNSSQNLQDMPPLEGNSEFAISDVNYNLHIIFSAQKASINIEAINMRIASLINEMEASYIAKNDKKDIMNSLIIAAKTTSLNSKSYSQDLGLVQLQSPSIYVSYQEDTLNKISDNVLKVAGNCKALELLIRQDIIALIEVIDLIIVDEVAQINELTNIRSRNSPCNAGEITFLADISSTLKLSIALFLDRYHINVQLLPSLTHDVFGDVARASVATKLNSEIVFDFDIKDHSHDIKTSTGQGNSSISLLKMPPTNGRIVVHMSEEETSLSIFASVEPVILDAAVVHSLLAMTNRPEFFKMTTNVQNNINDLKSHLYCIFYGEESRQKPKSSSKKPLLYDAHLTVAGFGIFANALGVDRRQETARLDLNLGCVQLVAMNCLDNGGSILKNPELRISLNQIIFELARWNTDKNLEPCGNLSFAALLTVSSKINDDGNEVRSFNLKSDSLNINLFADTASAVVDVLGHLQNKIKDIDYLSGENLRKFRPQISVSNENDNSNNYSSDSGTKFESSYSLELFNVQVSWLVGNYGSQLPSGVESEDLILSLRRMDFSTRKQNSAQLKIEALQLQMVPSSQNKTLRSLNSALLPEVIFNVGHVSTEDARRLAFQVGGKLLDIRLTSRFMIPVSALENSFVSAIEKFREASVNWLSVSESQRQQNFLGKKCLESLLIDADFAGAVVHLSNKFSTDSRDQTWGNFNAFQRGKFHKVTNDDSNNLRSNTILRSPGLACKIEYKDCGLDDLSLNAEVKVDASSNILYPSVVPLILEISSTVKEIVSDEKTNDKESTKPPQEVTNADDSNLLNASPSTVLDRTRLNLGLRICRQEFGLSCQPIARVAATAQFEEIYLAVNTVRSNDHGHFFAASATITELKASVQHVYSRDATGSFHVANVILSLMNSKHVGSTNGLAAILKFSPMKLVLNAKQLQDFLLFREIWIPPEIRQRQRAPTPPISSLHPQTILVQRYQQVAATDAFPWNAIVSIAELDMQVDLGQAIGKSAFTISNLWLSSKKNSAWEQNLCLGIDKVDVESTGRMSGLVALQDFKLRTSIQWPVHDTATNQTPLVEGSIMFNKLCAKAAFDYQAFLVADIESLHFLMYNVRSENIVKDDRLMAVLDVEAVQIFCTTTTSSQALALHQTFEKLIQEKRSNFETSLSEIGNFLKRSSLSQTTSNLSRKLNLVNEMRITDSPLSLYTDVIVKFKAVNVGVFPTTFLDQQVFKLEALNTEARFAVTMDNGKIHSTLGLTLGQLRIGLAYVKNFDTTKSLGDISVEQVVNSATGSRGGTILKVPSVEATMQTWQVPKSNQIDYIFKSFFGGKVEVGWNYSRISSIRGMWAAHSKALAQQLGKPLPLSAVRITGVPDGDNLEPKEGEQQKITAEVNVPQSKYDYNALEPPIIETPQLRDMGDATPPLEWIGLHRDRLPNLTHQIVIVTLLELASQVEDAYGKILGSP